MPPRRTPINRKQTRNRITPEAIDLFRRCLEGEDARVELHRLLGRYPPETNVMDAANPEPPHYILPIHDYEGAHKLYLELVNYLE
jgi:hypothetical protein